jgi:shikimate kinase
MDESLAVVLIVPEAKTPTMSVRDLPYAPFAPLAREAHALALRGRWQDALTLNGLVAGALYGTPPAWTRDALAAGALCAGVSGTGPAFAAVCRAGDAKAVEAALGGRTLVTRPTNRRAEEIA